MKKGKGPKSKAPRKTPPKTKKIIKKKKTKGSYAY
jgi:hypothetical protein